MLEHDIYYIVGKKPRPSTGAFKIEHQRRNSMQSLTYKEIIDDKIAEWQRGLEKLEEQKDKFTADNNVQLNVKVEQLKSAIDAVIVQLHDLDEQETVYNTMETKDKILTIFSSIDKGFTEYQKKTPFML